MNTEQKVQLFEKAPVPKAVLQLCIPTIISSLVMVLYNLADTYFVGMLNDPIQNAGVTLTAPVILAFNAVNNLFGVGTSSMMSRALGKKDMDTVHRSSAFGFYCTLFSGLLFSALCTVFKGPLMQLLGATSENTAATAAYMTWTVNFGAAPAILNVVMAYLVRAEGAALHASIGTMSGCILNIILDPLFILPFGMDMGAAGAGLATFISNCFACTYFFVLLFIRRKTTCVCIHPRMFSLRRRIVTGVCGVGIPAAVQNLLNVTGMTILNNAMSVFGSAAVAAIGIAQKINVVPFYVALGLSQGIMPLLSYNYASGNFARLKKSLLFAFKIAMPFVVAVSIGFYFGANGLIGLFMPNEQIIQYGAAFMRGLCLALPFLFIDFITVAVFQSCGMGRKAFLFAILRKVVLEIPLLYLLNALFPMYGLAYAQFAAESILALIAVGVLVHMFRRLSGISKKP